ncbi:MAG: YcxB family protein [Myxococcota bacterium]|nr:YcxB family protein [Myxococcota bacterium]
MTTPEPITLRFQYTEPEYRDAVRRHFARRLRPRRDLGVAVLGLAGSAVMFATGAGSPWIAGGLGAAAGFLLLVLAVAFWWMPGHWWRTQPKLHTAYQLELDDEGLAFRTGEVESKLRWSFYDRLVSDDCWHFLYYGPNFTALPRRAFADREAEHRFLALAATGLTKPPR